MKKETFKQVLFSAALLASVFEVQAQDNPITFTRDATFRENYGWANWTASVNRIVGKPVPCLPKDWENGRSKPTLNL